jgi:hypothetical protein
MSGSIPLRHVVALAVFASAVACAPPVKAPDDVEEFTRFMYREWSSQDTKALEAGVLKLEAFLQGRDLKADDDFSSRHFAFEQSLTSDDLATVQAPEGTDPANAIGMAVFGVSKWPITDHAKLQSSGDLLPAERATARAYTRTYPDMSAPSCFDTRECVELNTLNVITRDNALLKVTFELPKKFVWVKLGADRWAIVARSWMPKVSKGSAEGTSLDQSYTLDVWLERPDGTTWRYQGIYTQSTTAFSDRDTAVSLVTGGADEGFTMSDIAIGERYRPAP